MGCDIHLYIEHAHPQPDDKKLYWGVEEFEDEEA